eukprot:CCRYP_015206-RA/>CCRYP_015206-RA protein AED:0.12 eAED:0.12 QI:301/0.92/0.93/1/0.85/0.8/15/353/1031
MRAIQSEQARHIQTMKGTADFIARDTATWFSNELYRAMMPLYGIRQAVIHSSYFDNLTEEIGRYPQGVIEETVGTMTTKRNVTGICDKEDLAAKFRSLVEPMNADNDLDDIVVSYRLFPNNVACLNEPSRVFTHFNVENSPQVEGQWGAESSLGFDAAHSANPFWNMIIDQIFIKQQLSIFGPFTLPPMKHTLCGHLAIWSVSDSVDPFQNVLNMNSTEVVGAWGFIMNFVDWGKLLDRSDIYQRFSSSGLEFELSRSSDPVMAGVDSAILAKSANSSLLNDENSIVVETDSLQGIWSNRVGSVNGWQPSWYPAAVAVVVSISLLFAFLTASMLAERQLHRDLLYKIMPRRAIQKIQRGQTVLEKFNLVTVFFSDIVGFTSMAGKMRPLQVMKMLNDLYTEFDKLVVKHGVYKVETIGDSFMVVSGAPDRVPAPLAAERVALFAIDAVNFVKSFRTKDGDQIFIRAGIASGKTVAGVVGNAMPRYCFFGVEGDAYFHFFPTVLQNVCPILLISKVNLASRMESTSVKMKIQVAELTYRLLQDSPNMLFDLERRKEGECFGIEVKGKGHQTTYWVKKAYKRVTLNKPIDAGTVDNCDIEEPRPNSLLPLNQVNQVDIPQERHDENSCVTVKVTDELLFNPREIYRALTAEDWAVIGRSESPSLKATEEHEVMIARFVAILHHHLQLVLEERKPGSGISCSVQLQLAKYVNAIADTYDDPKFHQLSHAMHVTTSMNKLLYFSTRNGEVSSALENFSLVFAAFLHDAGHTGMTNKMLEDNQHPLSKKYAKDVPIAERFAIEIACDVLMCPEYEALRTAIMPDDKSKLKFAKALFQSILVTDIASPSRVKLCVQRYDTSHNRGVSTPDLCPLAPHLPDIIALVFNGRKDIKESYPDEFCITPSGLQECVRREHLMLISDVAHLLQCWENFVKWNFRLYKEIHENFTKGLCPDPSVGWYEGQIGFLEKYAIPLAIRSQIFFTKEFSQSLVDLGHANLICWKDHGIVASSIMVTGVKENENENLVLKRLYCLQNIRL